VRDLSNAGDWLRPGDRLSHVSAARILGVPLPADADARIHVSSAPGLSQVRARGFVGHRDATPAVHARGVAVSEPSRMFLELAQSLRLDDLVAAGDHLVLVPRFAVPGRPFARLADLAAAAAVGCRVSGAPRARRALELVRPGVESPQETRLRLLLTRAGLPEPECGYELRARSGRWIGWFDLAWPAHRVLGEYDGDQHRTDPVQYDRDIRRFDLASDEGWRVIRVRAPGLRPAGRAETVRRFRTALAGPPGGSGAV